MEIRISMHKPDLDLTLSYGEVAPDNSFGIATCAGSEFEKLYVASSLDVRREAKSTPAVQEVKWRAVEAPVDSKRPGEPITRALDFTFALGLVLVLLPALFVLALVVAVDCHGWPIFAHTRVGRGGRSFKCYKFRSMCANAEAKLVTLLQQEPALRREWAKTHKLANDPRITRLGRVLRRTSLDELPQLFNVLKGEMSLVGPRPVVLGELPRYGRFQASYLAMRPGLTGLWQVTCRSESTYRRRVAIDRLYARRKCLKLDFRILLATVPAVLSRNGAC